MNDEQKRTTPEFITELQPNEIFVFGSNINLTFKKKQSANKEPNKPMCFRWFAGLRMCV